jgi:hypothetical protein
MVQQAMSAPPMASLNQARLTNTITPWPTSQVVTSQGTMCDVLQGAVDVGTVAARCSSAHLAGGSSLAGLARTLLGALHDKGQQCSDWSLRRLSTAQAGAPSRAQPAPHDALCSTQSHHSSCRSRFTHRTSVVVASFGVQYLITSLSMLYLTGRLAKHCRGNAAIVWRRRQAGWARRGHAPAATFQAV